MNTASPFSILPDNIPFAVVTIGDSWVANADATAAIGILLRVGVGELVAALPVVTAFKANAKHNQRETKERSGFFIVLPCRNRVV